jgi:hypothetical protein
MPRYTSQIFSGNFAANTYKSLAALQTTGAAGAATLRRISIYELVVGQYSGLNLSTDTQVLYDVGRFTTTSLITGTAFTPSPLDGGDPATLATLNVNLASEPAGIAAAGASGGGMLNPAINQRGTFRWRALDDGDNIIVPATTLCGIAVRAQSGNFTGVTATAIGTIMYQE